MSSGSPNPGKSWVLMGYLCSMVVLRTQVLRGSFSEIRATLGKFLRISPGILEPFPGIASTVAESWEYRGPREYFLALLRLNNSLNFQYYWTVCPGFLEKFLACPSSRILCPRYVPAEARIPGHLEPGANLSIPGPYLGL